MGRKSFRLVVVVGVVAWGAVARGGSYYTDVTDLFPMSAGVYDEGAFEANSIDVELAGNVKTLSQFKTDLLAAYNGNCGDVIGFDHGRGPNPWGSQALYRSEWSPGYGSAKNWIWPAGDPDYKCPTKLWYGKDYAANKDGLVDLQDFGLLKDNFGIGIGGGATWEQGDFNHDGGVDLQDFGILKDHFGHSTSDSPVAAVPEPASAALLLLGAGTAFRRRGR